LPAEELAAETAKALSADKLIYIQLDHGDSGLADTLSTSECDDLIQNAQMPSHLKELLKLAVSAIQSSVKRVHIIDQRVDGGLLLELFTRDGYGTMITNLFYEGMRSANIDDIGGILRLIEPLEATGALVERSREQLELEIRYFQVIEKDGMIIACVACIPEPDHNIAEIACLAVHDSYRRSGLGKQLLQIAEHQAVKQKIHQLYILTTRTSHWFIENGFVEASISSLPDSKRTNYNDDRRSKIMMKTI